MRRRILLVLTTILFFSLCSQAQTMGPTLINPKVEAKKLSKDGYKILPEALYPMKKQLEFVHSRQVAKDEIDGTQKYIIGFGKASDTTLVQAKSLARTFAVEEIVNQVCFTLQRIIDENGGLQEKGTSTEKILNLVSEKCKQKMAYGPILADVYKKKNEEFIVMRYCAYGVKEARTMAIEFLENELKNEPEKLKTALRNPNNWFKR